MTKIFKTLLEGVEIIESEPYKDERGSFTRILCNREMKSVLGERKIVQINHSITNKVGSIRGMHYQKPPYAEMKIIRCIKGKVFDVVIDLRKNSATFLKWVSLEMSPYMNNAIIIPEGCAHGFQVLEPYSELIYFHTEYYNKESEAAVYFADKEINIQWPMKITDISLRDKNIIPITKSFSGVKL